MKSIQKIQDQLLEKKDIQLQGGLAMSARVAKIYAFAVEKDKIYCVQAEGEVGVTVSPKGREINEWFYSAQTMTEYNMVGTLGDDYNRIEKHCFKALGSGSVNIVVHKWRDGLLSRHPSKFRLSVAVQRS